MRCDCGDICCHSCGPAQGNFRCFQCGKWDSDGGCDDPKACEEAEAVEAAEEAAMAEAEQTDSDLEGIVP